MRPYKLMERKDQEVENLTSDISEDSKSICEPDNEININKNKGLKRLFNKKTGTTSDNHDEAIFKELQDKKKKKKKRFITTIIIIATLVLACIITAVVILRRRVNQMSLNIGDVVSYQAETGNISTTVSGYGSLSNCNEDEIKVPANVEINEVVISANDEVKEGDIIATVNSATVLSAMSNVQDEIDDLDEDITSAKNEYINSYITSGVYGRVMKLYISPGDEIAKVMYDNGAIALISLDGYMAFNVSTDKLTSGETVRVIRDDEKKTEIQGTVEIVSLGKATILVNDAKALYNEKLTVMDSDGNELGSGNAYIHNQLKVTGTQGTVSYISAKEGSSVYAGSYICSLTDLTYTGTYNSLLQQREEKEDELNQLIKIHQDGALTAPYSGRISAINYDEENVVEGEETSIVNITDDKEMSVTINVDEANILSLEIGQMATVSISSIGDEEFDAVLTEINKTATSSSGVTKYTATVTLDKTNDMIAGMTSTVIIKIQGVENAVIIPVEALHQTSSTSYVYTTYDESTGQFGGIKEVEVGIQNSSYVEIISGLNEGDTVYYTETENSAMAQMMSNGMPDFGGSMSGGNFGGERPDFSSGNKPDFSGGMPSGGGMPDFSGGRP